MLIDGAGKGSGALLNPTKSQPKLPPLKVKPKKWINPFGPTFAPNPNRKPKTSPKTSIWSGVEVAPKTKPKAPKTAPITKSSGGGGGGGGESASKAIADTEPVKPKTPTEEDYLKGDATYQATVSALAKQLTNYETDVEAQKGKYGIDYNEAVKNLGYVAPTAKGAEASWNWDDPLTASGRGMQNQLNDFASRGMLQSSGYANAFNDLGRSLMDQYTGMTSAKTTFEDDLARQLTTTKDENTAALQAAQAEALLRRAVQYGLV